MGRPEVISLGGSEVGGIARWENDEMGNRVKKSTDIRSIVVDFES